MSKKIFFASIIFFQSCLDMVTHKDVMDFKMNDTTLIRLKYIGGGATAPDYLKIEKENSLTNAISIIKVFDGINDRHVFHFQKINDTVVLFNIIDTELYAPVNRNFEYRLNINQIDTTLNKYK